MIFQILKTILVIMGYSSIIRLWMLQVFHCIKLHKNECISRFSLFVHLLPNMKSIFLPFYLKKRSDSPCRLNRNNYDTVVAFIAFCVIDLY